MKKIKMRAVSAIALFAVIFSLASCTTTKVISSLATDSPNPSEMKKVLVVGIMKNRETTGNVEKAMVGELVKAGVNATAATDVFGPKGFTGLTEEQITDKLKGSDYSSVMIVSLIDKEKDVNFYPTGYTYPGYYTTSTNYVLEADMYTINDDDRLLYSAQTRSFDPASLKSLADSFSKSIIAELKAKGFVN